MARKVSVEIVGDASSLERAFLNGSKAATVFENSVSKSARGAVAASVSFHGLGRSLAFASAQFLGGAGIVYGFKQLVSETSRVQEETEKTSVVFGSNARAVQSWSKTLAESFGVSEGAALQATGQFGNMLRPLGFGTKAAAAMSERLVELAADMASFNNAKPADVLQALASGLAGQVRPLRQYGVFLSQTRIQTEAYADGIAKQGAKLNQAQKVQAAYNIILKDTRDAQGDVARNSESLSVAMSKLNAGIQDLESGLGSALLPTITMYVNRAAKWLNNTQNQQRVQRDFNEVLHLFTRIIEDASTAAQEFTGAMRGLKNVIVLLIGLKVASWLNKTQGELIGVGATAKTSAGEVTGLKAALMGLNGITIAPIVIPIEQRIQSNVSKDVKKTLGSTAASIYDYTTGFLSGGAVGKNPFYSILESGTKNKFPDHSDHRLRRGDKVGQTVLDEAKMLKLAESKAAANAAKDPGTATPYLSYLLDQAQATTQTGDDRTVINRILKVLRSRLSKAKGLKAKSEIQSAINDYTDQIAQFDKQIEDARQKAHQKELDRLKKEREAAQKRAAELKAQLEQRISTAFGAIGDIGQGPIATGPAAQFLEQFGGHLTGKAFAQDIKAQNNAFSTELANLRKIRARGGSQQLVNTLLGQGDQGAGIAAGLASANARDFKTFVKEYQRRQKLVMQAAKMEVNAGAVTVSGNTVVVGASDAKGRPTANKFGRVGSSARRS